MHWVSKLLEIYFNIKMSVESETDRLIPTFIWKYKELGEGKIIFNMKTMGWRHGSGLRTLLSSLRA